MLHREYRVHVSQNLCLVHHNQKLKGYTLNGAIGLCNVFRGESANACNKISFDILARSICVVLLAKTNIAGFMKVDNA